VTIDPAFARLLARQNDLQTFLTPQTIAGLSDDERAAFIRTQALALVAEVIETIDETHWKPWAKRPEGAAIITDHTRYTNELADAFIFLMNLMLAGGVSMMELARAVDAKQTKNLDRWMSGYDGKSSKCSRCGRAYDDPNVGCMPGTEDLAAMCVAD
jgi:hypothetical protein